MAITKQQIRGLRILLTVFYGFFLSNIIFRYIIDGIFEIIRRPTNPYAIIMVVLGGIVLILIALPIYAIWFDNAIIMLVSGVVLIAVFILTLVFDVLGILNNTSKRSIHATTIANYIQKADESSNINQSISTNIITTAPDKYEFAEDIIKLIIELLPILLPFLQHSFYIVMLKQNMQLYQQLNHVQHKSVQKIR